MSGAAVTRPADAFEYLGFPDAVYRGAVHHSPGDRHILIVWNGSRVQRITPLRFVLQPGNRNMITTLSGAIHAGLRCRCPRCGKGKLFAGFLTLRPRCEVCGLDYGFADSGDGPAIFIMFFAGAIVVGAALLTEILFQPPYWVHTALWLPLILIVTLGPLRPMKGLMIALQHYHKAEERRFGGGAP
jgi:uncharacterized protein (DUF983 family)